MYGKSCLNGVIESKDGMVDRRNSRTNAPSWLISCAVSPVEVVVVWRRALFRVRFLVLYSRAPLARDDR